MHKCLNFRVMAPEMLLGATNYTNTIDIWAAGVIMANIYLRKPLFHGTTDIDYLLRICSILGTPDKVNTNIFVVEEAYRYNLYAFSSFKLANT